MFQSARSPRAGDENRPFSSSGGESLGQFQKRTSDTHPLRTDLLTESPTGNGQIALTLMPGRKGVGRTAGVWDRDLLKDSTALWFAGFSVAVCLSSEAELNRSDMQLPTMQTMFEEHGIKFIFAPLHRDVELPVADLRPVVDQILDEFHAGHKVVIFSTDSWGRASVVGACCLLRLKPSLTAERAIQRVRTARSVFCLTNEAHIRSVEAFAEMVQAENSTSDDQQSQQDQPQEQQPTTDGSDWAGEEKQPKAELRSLDEVRSSVGGEKKIIIGLDGGDYSRKAAEMLLRMIKPGDRVLVTRVLDSQQQRPSALKDDYVRQFIEAGAHTQEVLINGQDAGKQLCKQAEDNQADVIIVGQHHGKVTTSTVSGETGPTADYILRYAPCSVMIAR